MHHSRAMVVCTTPEGGQVRATWPDVESCLTSEIERLHALVAPDYGRLRSKSSFRTLPGEPLASDLAPTTAVKKPWWRFFGSARA
jgi:hypothetical protein